ncbi:hypothetical protein KAJ27_12945 [bacterium]|nr:hypothetical protein [bacterium]
MVRKLLLISLIIMVYSAGMLFGFRYQVYFGPEVLENRQTLDQRFIDFIKTAKTSIDGAFYEIRIDSIANAFIAAHKRGVKVRLITDDDNIKNKWSRLLKKAGIPIKEDKGRSGLMHNKFCIVDGKKIWTGSYNLTDTGSFNNFNNGMWIISPELAVIYTREFKELFEERKFGKESPSTIEKQKVTLPHKGKTVDFEVLFAPEDNPNKRIAEILNGAKKSIYFMQFAFTEDKFSKIMIKKFKSGVMVKGIMDKMLYRATGPYCEFFNLTNNGMSINIAETKSGKFHHKVFIIDHELEGDAALIIGSGNASANANIGNDENIMIIRSHEIAGIYYKEFKRLFGRTSRVRADIIGFVNKASTEVKSLKLIIHSNGSSVGKISVQYPSRWDVDFKKGFKVSRSFGDTTDNEEIKFNKKGFVHCSLKLKPHGEDSYVIYTLGDFKIPDINGGYNFYIQTSPHDNGVKLMPLKIQPGIEINEHDPDEFLSNVFTAFIDNYNAIQLIKSDKDYKIYLQSWKKNARKITLHIISKIITTGDYSDVKVIVTALKKLPLGKRIEIRDGILPLYWFLKERSSVTDDEDAAVYSSELYRIFFDRMPK